MYSGGRESAIRRGVNQLSEERNAVTPTGKTVILEQRRIQELEVRFKRLEMEKDTLKRLR